VETNPFVGEYQSIYFGRTIDQEIRSKASGGGIVSALLISALQKGLIDGAIVVKIDEEDITCAKFVIAENKDQVLEAAQSKYILAPISAVLKQIKSKKGKFALVGLPCQIHAIRKLQASGPKWYSEKIRYLIGLFCGSSLRKDFIDYILSILDLRKENVKELHFRYRRNPTTSSLSVVTKDGKRFFIDRKDYSFLFYLFAREACVYCSDHTNESADVSVGDMRPFPIDSPNYKVVEPLQSVIVVRTEKGAELLKNASDCIKLSNYDVNDLIASKLTNMIDKKICTYTRMQLRKGKHFRVPKFNESLKKDYTLPGYELKIYPSKAFTPSRYLYELSWLTILHLTQNKNSMNLLSKVPPSLLKKVVRRYLHYKTWRLVEKIK
jgi:coenzyme F420 hydrogenase subunit beta